jgi:glutamate-1-semialdehyde 2,1-aminomutase
VLLASSSTAADVEAAYLARTPRSRALYERACAAMPGGDARAASFHPPYPIVVAEAAGSRLVDVDGNAYLDGAYNFASLVHGNAHPAIEAAAVAAVRRGTAWSARTEAAIDLAELLCERVASIDAVRFTNTGTESALLAVTLARTLTGRRRILMARGGYHGSWVETAVASGSQAPTPGPAAPGSTTLVADWGDADQFEAVLADPDADVACVLLEPVLGAGGVVPPPPGFLPRVQAAARRAGAVFVLDEVLVLRLAEGGAQSLYEVEPDLTLLGKVIGGGFPVGAVGGRADLLAALDPRAARLWHSGTWNANPVSMAAGLVSLQLLDAAAIAHLDRCAAAIADGLVAGIEEVGLPLLVRRVGSFVALRPTAADGSDAVGTPAGDALLSALHLAALARGVFMPSRGTLCTATCMTDADVAEVVDRLGLALHDVALNDVAASGGSA